MASLLLNGQVICNIQNVQIHTGHQPLIRVPIDGGRTELVPGLKDPDAITFTVPFQIDIQQPYSVRLDNNTTLEIMIDKINNNHVHALIQGT